MRRLIPFLLLNGVALPLGADDPADARHDLRRGQYVIVVKDNPVKGRSPREGKTTVIKRGTEVKITRVKPDRIAVRHGVKSEWVAFDDVVTRDEAIDYFTKAIEENPNADDYQNRAARYFFEDEAEKALADLEKAIELDPSLSHPHYHLGQARRAKGDLDGALAHFNTIIRLDPTSPISGNAHAARAKILLEKGEWTKSLADYSESIRISPSMSRFRQEKAWLLATCPDADVRDGQKALELALVVWHRDNWNDPANAETAAAAWAEIGDFARARAFIESAMVLESNDDDSHRKEMLAAFGRKQPWRIAPDP